MSVNHFIRSAILIVFMAMSGCSIGADSEPNEGPDKLPTKMHGAQEPLLDLQQSGRSMRRVYFLSQQLRQDPQQVELTRRLTLDASRPTMGLKGSFGLFASSYWWENINSRKMPLRFRSGTIIRAYEAGQDQAGLNNTVNLRLSDGATEAVGIYVNEPKDVALFKPGAYATVVFALDELKSGDNNLGDNKLAIALEMAVSVD